MKWKKQGICLIKEFKFNNFVSAVKFVKKILPIAEKINHHPDLLIHSYNKVIVLLTTHKINKITEKDYFLAEKIDKLYKIDT